MDGISSAWRTGWVRAVALALVTCGVYAASLGGGFLNYDDPWLIERNPYLGQVSWDAVSTIFFDLSYKPRMRLGAEYLPLRDFSVWLDVALFGKHAPALRAMQLGLYVAAALAFRAAFVAGFGRVRGELWAWLFVLHPAHLESVAWLAGRKDVLALLFMGLALWRHTVDGRDARYSVPLLWLAACLSKSMAVGLLGPLLATDLWLRRRPDPWRYGGSLALVGFAAALHVHVGQLVHMVSGPLDGQRAAAVWTMGPVWLRYLAMTIDPALLSVRHDVPLLAHPTLISVAGWTVLLGSGLAATWFAIRRNRRLPLVAWLWFAVPLGPVSQVLVPLQNLLADRYLWLSVAGPMLLLAHLDAVVSARLAHALTLSVLAVVAGTTAMRAPAFADSVRLFAEATAKTEHDPIAPYQLGMALQAEGEADSAIAAFLIARERARPDDPTLASASNNLAKLLVQQGKLEQARAVLDEALRHQPDSKKLRRNRAKVLAKLRVRDRRARGSQPPTTPTE